MRTTLLAGSLLALSAIAVEAQQVKLDQFKNWKPRNIGPAGMSGRITAIDAVVDNPNIIYLGAASGGVWKTENGGTEWKSLFDDQPILNIGSIAIQQSNPNIVWVGTGEGNPRNSINIGEGIYKSLDAGKTWQRMGLEKTRNIHRVIIDPTNPNTVYAGAIGNPYAEHPERGVFKTTDGGQTWNKILYTNDTSGVADMIMDPSNPNKLFAGMWQHRRTPWSFSSGGKGSGLYMTIDGGKNWKKLGKENGLPSGDYGRIGLAISRSNPNVVYALVEATKNGLYKSEDGGYNWKLVNDKPEWVTNRPFYFQEIAVDPQNENRLWLIYQMIAVSEDGGKDFRVVIPYNGIHPDHHAFWIHPKDNKFIIDGNDGGIGITRDMGKNWMFDEKLPVGQFYHINVDNEMPYNVMGGMQDNGSWRGPAYTWISGGIKNYYWESLWGGDGFDAMPDPDDANWVYAESQGGFVGRYNIKTGEQWFIRPAPADLNVQFRFNWNAAMAQDPFDKNTIYYGSQYLHKSTNKGVSWELISGDLTTNDSSKIDQSKNGGLSLDITGAENHCTILTIAPSAKEKGVIWVGTDDGNVQLTRDGGKTWTNFRGKIPGMPIGAWIPQIQASRHNAGEAFVTVNDYRRGDFKPYIFRTTDYGKTWTRMVDEKKVVGYALCMIQDPTQPNLIFVGTEQGLWVSMDNGVSFQQWKNGYPSVSTYDMAIQEREADLAIATFGRAIWILDDIRPLRDLAANKGVAPGKAIKVFESPKAYQASYRNAPGYEWSTWGIWDAENRKPGAPVSFFVDPSKLDSLSKKKADSVGVKIYNDKNELIRNLKWKVDSGYNRNYWGMEEKGVRRPGSPKPKAGAPEPGGEQVLPGNYKVVVTLGNAADSTLLSVNDDPRFGNRNEVRIAQAQLRDRLRKSSDKLTEGMDRLTEAEDITKKLEAQLKDITGKEADTLRTAGKKMQDEIKAIREFINGKTIERQGYGRPQQPPTTMSTLQQANMYIGAKGLKPGPHEEQLVANAETKINEAVVKINQFFDSKWKDYRKLVESTPVKLFKDYTPIQ
ncbi:hypothetical protein KJS94_14125 [Flavihumibacter rivuli]|uniref:VPS10 domain-containing protein n=1 Tax=Flavihumibacter rivuli TaxID=2838156 RepID=UPI001BDF611A|nr:hypothetical protein [Flavihumibacter rivuli]ULQ55782.1 hypothetical protein KJS94_14125 [Flavihumibacter rivuli]